ncbi:hypothetical protein L202_01397 [Cryptococcus amylolentus CBS 6039]|uniref:Rgp1-domain-containing protein n=1 Tax=Cryptococcus amylolentus CBS 6039 TaxID=1295533 RepID=A0A1E3I3H4_9TREE|nr:hypothetical protein L202_01397 [Cryptococcus amylolentus CBS 6039]ODN83210.1 hypothetical protein L202_01397 [Cryptococcus amylolentus CBS 6039]
MASYFPSFSAPSPMALAAASTNFDDPHLEVTVTPSASAFYAGETFSATITIRNTRTPSHDAKVPETPLTVPPTAEVSSATSQTRPLPPMDVRHPSDAPQLPRRLKQIGAGLPDIPLNGKKFAEIAEAGPSGGRTPMRIQATPRSPDLDSGYPYSPGANTAFRAPGPSSPQREGLMNFRSPEGWGGKENTMSKELGHQRRARSLALGKGAMSPQELVWALGGQKTPPPLPSRRSRDTQIPAHHPHSRKISIANPIAAETSGQSEDNTPPPLESIIEGQPSPSGRPRSSTRPSASRSNSQNDLKQGDRPVAQASPNRPRRPSHNRTPSYQNAYGASFMGIHTDTLPPPPSHPFIREREPPGTTTVLWAYTRLVGHFHPSNTYIPPDPLLPLRAILLHQPVGSGSLLTPGGSSVSNPAGKSSSSSRWQLSFGTGAIGNATQPSLTGSLFGLAKELITGGGGGSLEEERRRVWNMKDLPVLESTRSLMGVDIRLKEGESRDFVYTMPLPTVLPPAHRGKAFRFSYDLVISLSASLPGGGHRQKSKDIVIPIRIWANVSVGHPYRTYDVLHPVIQTKEEGNVQNLEQPDVPSLPASSTPQSQEMRRQSSASDRHRIKNGDTRDSLQAYASHLVDTLKPNGESLQPMSPSKRDARSRTASPSSPVFRIPATDPIEDNTDLLDIPQAHRKGKGSRHRNESFVEGDEELLDEVGHEGGCGEAVEILSRHSPKASYDINKDGHPVSVMTLAKTTYRLGESVLGIVTFNHPTSIFRVLKFSAYLTSHELIPEPLLPPPVHAGGPEQPNLQTVHAEYHTAYALSAERLAFLLDIPSDATPAFSLAAGEGDKGGLEWRIKLKFTVGVPAHGVPKSHRRSVDHSRKSVDGHAPVSEAVNLIPTKRHRPGDEGDNAFYSALQSLNPVIPVSQAYRDAVGPDGGAEWSEMRTEMVECEVPVKVLAGNTAFLVRPAVFVV